VALEVHAADQPGRGERIVIAVARALFLALLVSTAALAIDEKPAFEDPAMQSRYEALTRELRCTVCQNQSIADSNASLARDLRREVRRLMEEGRSDQEIRDFLTDRYTDFVLYNPPVKPRTYLLWAAPGLLVIIGLGVAVMVVLRRAQAAKENPAVLDADNETGSP
jgi:cytochrome c-type biogenesis protein CcmH